MRGECVFDGVMQDGGCYRLIIKPQVSQNPRDFNRVTVIRIARCALLRAVFLHRKHIGAVDQRLISVRIIGLDPFNQFILPEHRSRVGGTARICKCFWMDIGGKG